MSNHRKNKHSWKNQRWNETERKVEFSYRPHFHEDIEKSKERQEAIIQLKQRKIFCPICNEQISDMASAIQDESSGNPAHFDCVLNSLSSKEDLAPGEKIAYIGHGRFAVIYYENPNDIKSFKIRKIIEYENIETVIPWRTEMSELYSKVL